MKRSPASRSTSRRTSSRKVTTCSPPWCAGGRLARSRDRTVARGAHAPARATTSGRPSSPSARNGRYVFTVEAWPDLFATWVSELKRKVDGGPGREERAARGRRAARAAPPGRARHAAEDAERLAEAASACSQGPTAGRRRRGHRCPALVDARWPRYPDRAARHRYDRVLEASCGRARTARFGAWYEFFPRSAPRDGQRARHLPGRRGAAALDRATWASTSSTCRPSTPSAAPRARARTTRLTAGPRRRGQPLGHRRRRGRPQGRPPRARHARGLPPLRRRRADAAGHRDRAGLRLPVLARITPT